GAFAQITSTGLVRFVVNYDSGDDLHVDSVTGLVDAGERVFIALVTDGTTSASGMKIYVNGAPAATSFTQDATGTPRSLTGDWLIGRSSGAFATGRIADFRTFDSALSPAEVAAIYARGPNPGREVLPGLILPSSLQLGDRDPGDGSLRKTSATFQVVDYGGRVS